MHLRYFCIQIPISLPALAEFREIREKSSIHILSRLPHMRKEKLPALLDTSTTSGPPAYSESDILYVPSGSSGNSRKESERKFRVSFQYRACYLWSSTILGLLLTATCRLPAAVLNYQYINQTDSENVSHFVSFTSDSMLVCAFSVFPHFFLLQVCCMELMRKKFLHRSGHSVIIAASFVIYFIHIIAEVTSHSMKI